jgi:hypothetical protein
MPAHATTLDGVYFHPLCLSVSRSHLVLFVRDLLFSQVTGKENTEDTYDVNLTNVNKRARKKRKKRQLQRELSVRITLNESTCLVLFSRRRNSIEQLSVHQSLIRSIQSLVTRQTKYQGLPSISERRDYIPLSPLTDERERETHRETQRERK